jgi:peptide/nickel transport system ATP-binding protein
VLLSHDLDVVRALADRVLVIRDGRVVESGPVTEVLSQPAHEYTRALVAAQPTTAPPLVACETPGKSLLSGVKHATSAGVGAPRVVARELTARHHAVTALHQIDLELAAGECLAVVGRSGSGKTTLARCVAGLHPPSAGTLLLNGTPLPGTVRRRSRAELAAVQYVFQDAHGSFDQHRGVLDQISRTAVRLRGQSAEQARSAARIALAELGVTGATVERRPANLSGGELQRAALARALLAEPQVLICDEITSGLDTVTQAGILHQLAELRTRHALTLVLISHDLAVVASLADRIAVLHNGRIVEHGPAATVLTQPRHPITRQLLNDPVGVTT